MSYLENYFNRVPRELRKSSAIAYMAAFDHLKTNHPFIVEKIIQELQDQRCFLKLIASENYCSESVQLAMGNWLTDKYAEGYPYHRFYAGCDNIDAIEAACVGEAKAIFQCEHAYVQPHSGADANLVAFWAILVARIQNKQVEKLGKKNINDLSKEEYEQVRQLLVNQKVLGMSLNSGGHLTHGYRHNISAKMMQAFCYEVDPNTHLLDYKKISEIAKQEKPAILIAGYSAYSRKINFAKMREIADSVGAVLLVDMAHFAGLVAGKVMVGEYNPIPYAQMITSTTHKTLRGPRGGMILCQKEFREVVDKGCPITLGGPLPHVIAAKAVAFKEANTSSFCVYAEQIVKNAQALANGLIHHGIHVLTGGTENHLMVLEVSSSLGLTGLQAENALRQAHFTVNRNSIPFDKNGPWFTSGVRIGTAALTTLGMKEQEMTQIADWIYLLLKATKPAKAEKGNSRSLIEIDSSVLKEIQKHISVLLKRFPLYPDLIFD
ncbi:MAG: glycine hydroxymethyltransferase [Candidatus Rhabdochlamydia sp.]